MNPVESQDLYYSYVQKKKKKILKFLFFLPLLKQKSHYWDQQIIEK